MSRYAPRPAAVHYSFGPGPITPAVKWLIIANVAMFLATWIYEPIILFLGLTPRIVIEQFWIWQLATYAFLHGGAVHILFNMLGIWMFGVELERLWGTRQFVKYYAITGVGAGLTVLAVGLVLGPYSETYRIPTIGASGALYGLLVAFAYYYPDRPLLMFFLFPIPAKYFVMIVGAMAFLSAPQSRVSEAAHLGGLVIGYLYLRAGRGGLTAELKYRYLKWKMNRLRRKFDVYSGGRSDWDRHVH
ncbi:MAG TPA: rhomboid family intramembrane serine protease [Vicinamibacterales bacterium]|jgi:membrane associated rhomboid family serine protease|nr:rhomboid family intramembrane serine protease [Vicinamibacterales bacterium]